MLMLFKDLAEVFQKVEETSSRNEITEMLSDVYKNLSPQEGAMFSYLLMGRVAPLFVPAEFDYSEKGLLRVLQGWSDLYGVKIDTLEKRGLLGDIGLVAQEVVTKINDSEGKKWSSLSGKSELLEVYEVLWQLVNESGEGSMQRKDQIVQSLIGGVSPLEAKFLARVITGKLRLGASDRTLLDVLSYVESGDKEHSGKLASYYGAMPDIGILSYKVLKGGVKSAKGDVKVGVPLKSRLVERVSGFPELFERLGEEFYLQPKFDGLRCQAHVGVDYSEDLKDVAVWAGRLIEKEDGQGSLFGESKGDDKIKLFSRNLEELTSMFPEIVEALEVLDVESCILDSELIGYDKESGSYLPFQETISRKRKHGVEQAVLDTPVKIHIFDILELNGRSLLEVDTKERLGILEKLVKGSKSKLIEIAETRLVHDESEVQEFFDSAVKEGLEGLIAKRLDGGYQPGKRNFEWIKLKKSMDKKLVDNVDVVIMGYYYGSGKKVGFGMGALLGGVYNNKTESIESVTKIGTGITDEQWGVIAKRLKGLEVKAEPSGYLVGSDVIPDVWVSPEVVCSVEADEITKSKMHLAAKEELGHGLALRFPRLVEFDRDKRVEDATSAKELAGMFS